jgi:hypothetical protein
MVDQLADLEEQELLAGLGVLAKDMDAHLEANARDDAGLFTSAFSEMSRGERMTFSDTPFFERPERTGLPQGIAERAERGEFDLAALKSPEVLHEWTMSPGLRLFERFKREFEHTICGPDGPYEKFNKGLVGQADLPVTIAAAIIAAGISVATFWCPLAVYIALLLVKTGLAVYCEDEGCQGEETSERE